jgi:hypothetical protein
MTEGKDEAPEKGAPVSKPKALSPFAPPHNIGEDNSFELCAASARSLRCESFTSKQRQIDLEILDLIAQRRTLCIHEAIARTAAGSDLSLSLKPAETALQELIEAGRVRGLDLAMVEQVFHEIVSDSERAFQGAAASALAEPRVSQTVLRIARHKDVPEFVTSSLLARVCGIPGAVGDERQTADVPSTFELVSTGAVIAGFVRCDVSRFEELARVVELLLATGLTVVYRALLSGGQNDEDAAVADALPAETVLVVAKELLVVPTHASWASWLFLRVPETRSVQSTDILIRALLTARQYRLDTRHLHSFPGMSYEGFSYLRDAEGLETRPHYSQRGSRAFLIDAHRSPGPEQLDQLVSALLELGCSAQVLGCMPRLEGVTSGYLRENPIQRSTTRIAALSTSRSKPLGD